MIVVWRLWAVVDCGPMDIDRGSDDYGFDFRLWVVGHGSWSDGPMVVGGGSDGLMVVGGAGGDGPMIVVLVH